jgi:hypothetical protein
MTTATHDPLLEAWRNSRPWPHLLHLLLFETCAWSIISSEPAPEEYALSFSTADNTDINHKDESLHQL